MKHYSQLYSVREGEVLRCFDADLYDAMSEHGLYKSANTKVSEYNISLTTQDSFNTYKNYAFSLNELECTFSTKDDSLIELILRDTSVNKKITVKETKGTLTYAKGQDTVGKHSEVNNMTSKENIYSITLNGSTFETPFDIETIYEHLTGVNLEDARESLGEDIKDADKPVNWWTAFLKPDGL